MASARIYRHAESLAPARDELLNSRSDIPGNAPQWAIQRALKVVGRDEKILGVFVVSDSNRCSSVAGPYKTCLCPMFWGLLCLSMPCLICNSFAGNAILKSTVYILTDVRVYRAIDGDTWCICCNEGRDQIELKLTAINSVTVNNAARGSCCPISQVECNGGSGMSLLVDDPDEVARLIREAKDNARHDGANATLAAATIQADATTAATAQMAKTLAHSIESTTATAAAAAANAVAAATAGGQSVAIGYPQLEPAQELTPMGEAVVPLEMEHDAPRDNEPLAKIRALKELLDAGAITQMEFDEKKRALLRKV